MKTYAESRGCEPFDWNLWLAKAARDGATEEEWSQATLASSRWVTCATGNQCTIIPRDEKGQPKDAVAVILGGGSGFDRAIMDRDIPRAQHLLRLIELHSAFLVECEVQKLRENAKAAALALAEAEVTIGA